MIHQLKCTENYFQRLVDGTKTCDVRWNDRDFQVGDILEIFPVSNDFSRRRTSNVLLTYKITHVFSDPKFVQPGFVVLSLEQINKKL